MCKRQQANIRRSIRVAYVVEVRHYPEYALVRFDVDEALDDQCSIGLNER